MTIFEAQVVAAAGCVALFYASVFFLGNVLADPCGKARGPGLEAVVTWLLGCPIESRWCLVYPKRIMYKMIGFTLQQNMEKMLGVITISIFIHLFRLVGSLEIRVVSLILNEGIHFYLHRKHQATNHSWIRR